MNFILNSEILLLKISKQKEILKIELFFFKIGSIFTF